MKVLTPHFEGEEVEQLTFATRRQFLPGEQLHLLLVENGKPKARQLLQFVADEIKQRLPMPTWFRCSPLVPTSSSRAWVIEALVPHAVCMTPSNSKPREFPQP
jgi:hypothetical protein